MEVRAADAHPQAVRLGAAHEHQPAVVPGSVIEARVEARLSADRYVLVLAGQRVVADSALPLTEGSRLPLQVLSAGDGGLILRAEGLSVQLSQPEARLAALGLPATPAAKAVLAAFEAAAAPLDGERMRAALAAVMQAADAAAAERQLAAHVALARSGLPPTPMLLELATHAAQRSLPDVAASLRRELPALALLPADQRGQSTLSEPAGEAEARSGAVRAPNLDAGAIGIRAALVLAGVRPASGMEALAASAGQAVLRPAPLATAPLDPGASSASQDRAAAAEPSLTELTRQRSAAQGRTEAGSAPVATAVSPPGAGELSGRGDSASRAQPSLPQVDAAGQQRFSSAGGMNAPSAEQQPAASGSEQPHATANASRAAPIPQPAAIVSPLLLATQGAEAPGSGGQTGRQTLAPAGDQRPAGAAQLLSASEPTSGQPQHAHAAARDAFAGGETSPVGTQRAAPPPLAGAVIPLLSATQGAKAPGSGGQTGRQTLAPAGDQRPAGAAQLLSASAAASGQLPQTAPSASGALSMAAAHPPASPQAVAGRAEKASASSPSVMPGSGSAAAGSSPAPATAAAEASEAPDAAASAAPKGAPGGETMPARPSQSLPFSAVDQRAAAAGQRSSLPPSPGAQSAPPVIDIAALQGARAASGGSASGGMLAAAPAVAGDALRSMPAGVDAKRAALVGDGHAALATVGGRHGYPEPLLRVLARLAHAQLQRAASEEREEAAATVSSAESARAAPPAPAAQLQPLLAVMREALAEQVFPPRELADYDRVVPLPLATAHDTTPARLAVAQRTTASGQRATFIRVDAELSALGPVSVRLSGADGGGPIAITLVAGAAAAAALAEELPSLVADLRQLGLDAAVRVVSDA